LSGKDQLDIGAPLKSQLWGVSKQKMLRVQVSKKQW